MEEHTQLQAAEIYLNAKATFKPPTVIYDYKQTYNYIFRRFYG